jgi:hypothetical protein
MSLKDYCCQIIDRDLGARNKGIRCRAESQGSGHKMQGTKKGIK